jgi:hypothetical protein
MELRAEEISEIIKKQISEYGKEVEVSETGTIISIGDGIARIHGLSGAMAGELLEFPGGVSGMVLNLEEDNVGAAILGEFAEIKEGDTVKRTGRITEVPVGDALVVALSMPSASLSTARVRSTPAASARWRSRLLVSLPVNRCISLWLPVLRRLTRWFQLVGASVN